jgi:hypothetical protein
VAGEILCALPENEPVSQNSVCPAHHRGRLIPQIVDGRYGFSFDASGKSDILFEYLKQAFSKLE